MTVGASVLRVKIIQTTDPGNTTPPRGREVLIVAFRVGFKFALCD